MTTLQTPSRSMRIGELAERVGISSHLLRAWEKRYGLLQPSRSAGGYRLYDAEDERRVRAMLKLRQGGIAAHLAAAEVLGAERREAGTAPSDVEPDDAPVYRDRLRRCLEDFDEAGAQAAMDDLLAHHSVESAIGRVLLACLREIGERWESGEVNIAQEHFASHQIRARISSMGMGWNARTGPTAVLACPPGERHDIALLAFAVVLGRAGWRVCFLGADTPMPDLESACRSLQPALVVVATADPKMLSPHAAPLARIGTSRRLAIAGAAASDRLVRRIGAVALTGDPVTAVRELAGQRPRPC